MPGKADEKQDEQKRSKQKKITEFNSRKQASPNPQETPLKIKISVKKESQKKDQKGKVSSSNEPQVLLVDDPQLKSNPSANEPKTEPHTASVDIILPGFEMLNKVDNGSKKSWGLKDLLEMKQELENHLTQLAATRANYVHKLAVLEGKEAGIVQQKQRQSQVPLEIAMNKSPQTKMENLSAQPKQPQLVHQGTPPRAKPSSNKNMPTMSEGYFDKQNTAAGTPMFQSELLPLSEQAVTPLEQTNQIEDKSSVRQELLFDESQMKQVTTPLDMINPESSSLPLPHSATTPLVAASQGDLASKFLNDFAPTTPKPPGKMRKKKKKNVVDDDDDEEYDPNLERQDEEEEEELDNMDDELLSEHNQRQQSCTKPPTALPFHQQQLPSALASSKKSKSRRKAASESFPLLLAGTPGVGNQPTPSIPPPATSQTPLPIVQTSPPPPNHASAEEPMSPATPARGRKDNTPSSTKKKSTSGRQRRRRKAVSDITAEAEDLMFDSDEETKGFSTTTPNQLYWNYINHCFIPITPTSKKLQQLDIAPVDDDEIYVVPPLGKHYSEVWAEEDSKPQMDEDYMGDSAGGFGASSSMYTPTPSTSRQSRRGAHAASIGMDQSQGQDQFGSGDPSGANGSSSGGDINFEKPLLEIESASEAFDSHSITQRLLAALIEDVELSNPAVSSIIPNGTNNAVANPGHVAPSTAPHGNAPAAGAVGPNQTGKKTAKKGRPKMIKKEVTPQLPQVADQGPLQDGLRLATTDDYSVVMMQAVGERVFAELKTLALLDNNDILDFDKREDDEICAELRFLQNELRAKVELNNQRKSEVLNAVREHFEEEEKREKLDQEYKEYERQWREHLQSKKKRKTAS